MATDRADRPGRPPTVAPSAGLAARPRVHSAAAGISNRPGHPEGLVVTGQAAAAVFKTDPVGTARHAMLASRRSLGRAMVTSLAEVGLATDSSRGPADNRSAAETRTPPGLGTAR